MSNSLPNCTNRIRRLELIDGTLPAFTWPGFYPLIYLDSSDCVYCADCATINASDIESGWRITRYAAYYEGQTLQCEQCNKDIESAYGECDNDA